MSYRSSRFVTLLAATLVLLVAGVALASRRTISDGNDAPRKRVDIKRASHGHKGRKIVHTIVAYNRFRTSRGPCVMMDTNSTDGDDFAACGVGSGLINLNQQRTGGRLSIARPNRKTIVYKFRPRAIKQPAAYEWYVYGPADDECPGCDRAPNQGTVRHRL